MPVGERPASWSCAGARCAAADQRLLDAFAAQAAVVARPQPAQPGGGRGRAAGRGQQVRTALLAAVGHDLRTPLAAVKAAVSTPAQLRHRPGRRATGASCSQAADDVARPARRARRQPARPEPAAAGRVSIDLQPDGARRGRAARAARPRPRRQRVASTVPTTLPAGARRRRAARAGVANLVANALRYSPAGAPPHLTLQPPRRPRRGAGRRPRPRRPARATGSGSSRRSSGSATPTTRTGVGLGLALARGLTEAMGGTLEPPRTPPAAA